MLVRLWRGHSDSCDYCRQAVPLKNSPPAVLKSHYLKKLSDFNISFLLRKTILLLKKTKESLSNFSWYVHTFLIHVWGFGHPKDSIRSDSFQFLVRERHFLMKYCQSVAAAATRFWRPKIPLQPNHQALLTNRNTPIFRKCWIVMYELIIFAIWSNLKKVFYPFWFVKKINKLQCQKR